MQRELDALASNNTWEFAPLSPNKKPIESKWVYKVKLRSDGLLERHKADLLLRATTKMTTVRRILH